MSIEYPMVTICLPAYNHEKYVVMALESVLNDSYPRKEIVIINDGSTDLTHQRIEDWIVKNKSNISILYKYRENKGVCETFNELVSLSSGKYLTLLASDDYLLSGGILKRVEYLEKHSEKLAVFGDSIVINGKNEVMFESALKGLYSADITKYYSDTSLARQIVMRWSVPGPVLMVNKNIYKKIGSYNTKFKIEDWDFYLRMVSENVLGFIPDRVSAYRVHGENLSRKKGVACDMYKQMILIAMHNLPNFSFKLKAFLMFALSKYLISYVYNFLLARCRRI